MTLKRQLDEWPIIVFHASTMVPMRIGWTAPIFRGINVARSLSCAKSHFFDPAQYMLHS
jgi:hypothetical protein